MADPIPLNTRQERNPQPITPPLGNRPPFGNAPARPPFPARPNVPANPFQQGQQVQPPAARPIANPFQQGQPAAARPPATPFPPQRQPAPRPAANAQPANRNAPQGALFNRRQRQPRRDQGEQNETIMHVFAAVLLFGVIILSYLSQSPPSQVTTFAPQSAGVVAPLQSTPFIQPTAVPPTATAYSPIRWDWGAPGNYTGITGWVTSRTLIRACPNEACVALSNPTILEVGLLTDFVGIDPTRTWVQINASRPNGLGSGWIPLSAVRPNEDLSSLPVVMA